MLPNPFVQQITDAANKYGVDPNLALGVAHQESGINPNVADSPTGAMGIMQLEPGTAQSLGVNPRDPSQNIDGGVRYLRMLQDKFNGNPQMMLAGYNAGPQRAQEWAQGRSLPAETQNYIRSITAHIGNGLNKVWGGMQQNVANPIQTAFAGKTPMPNQSTPDNNQGIFSRLLAPGAMFNPQPSGPGPLGFLGGILRGAGVGSDDEIGRHLQNAGAGLIAIGNPSGAAALQNAANMPLFRQRFSVTSDAYGNRYIVNNHSGQVFNFRGQQMNGGAAAQPQQQPQASPQMQQAPQGAPGPTGPVQLSPEQQVLENQIQGIGNTPVGNTEFIKQQIEDSAKRKSALDQAAVDAGTTIDLANRQLALAKNPDVLQGTAAGIRAELAKAEAFVTGGKYGEQKSALTAEYDKNNAQLLGLNKSLLNGAKLAGPELGFMTEASPDSDKPANANISIFNHLIQQAQRTQAIAGLARKYKVLGPAFTAEAQQYMKNNPIYTGKQPGEVDASPSSGERPPLSSFEK
jgi:hypothetical protein